MTPEEKTALVESLERVRTGEATALDRAVFGYMKNLGWRERVLEQDVINLGAQARELEEELRDKYEEVDDQRERIEQLEGMGMDHNQAQQLISAIKKLSLTTDKMLTSSTDTGETQKALVALTEEVRGLKEQMVALNADGQANHDRLYELQREQVELTRQTLKALTTGRPKPEIGS